jgi:hypothetical protein
MLFVVEGGGGDRPEVAGDGGRVDVQIAGAPPLDMRGQYVLRPFETLLRQAHVIPLRSSVLPRAP